MLSFMAMKLKMRQNEIGKKSLVVVTNEIALAQQWNNVEINEWNADYIDIQWRKCVNSKCSQTRNFILDSNEQYWHQLLPMTSENECERKSVYDESKQEKKQQSHIQKLP